MPPLSFAYYCSGHAPQHVFADSIALGASYRYAEIDPVIVQPLAYRVDRQKNEILAVERRWLEEIKAHAVLSDAAFLGCLAANAAGIPSILITNFTFDSVYSYLSHTALQVDLESSLQSDCLTPKDSPGYLHRFDPDIPVPSSEVDSLVAQIFRRLPLRRPPLPPPGMYTYTLILDIPCSPSPDWVDASSNRFCSNIIDFLFQPPSQCSLHPTKPFQCSSPLFPSNHSALRHRSAPSRPPAASAPSVYTPGGRSRLLFSIGIPPRLHDPDRTKILIVSFGGQVFRAPSRPASRSQTRSTTPTQSPTRVTGPSISEGSAEMYSPRIQPPNVSCHLPGTPASPSTSLGHRVSPRLATPSHIWIPGAPPASKPSPGPSFSVPELATIPPTPSGIDDTFDLSTPIGAGDHLGSDGNSFDPRLLRTSRGLPSCAALRTGRARATISRGAAGDMELYLNASIRARLLSMEHGLRLLLDRDGVGVELSRQSYEAGDWALAVQEAWAQGKEIKAQKRANASAGIGMDDRKEEGLDMARKLVSWTQELVGRLQGTPH
ncbi:hypothetical protein D9615_010634 [Tricholomella constricta]|uniref:Uncharacterized protein n=1 Tax=Tricholomella constricta TaxID=117010 RepID=A0A8H5GJ35_9AGAR|nr:hypothetical protein D9615_010634 [Tricholomella constricta]